MDFKITETIKLNTLEFTINSFSEMFDILKRAVFSNKLNRDKKYIIIIKEIKWS
jgi:hypothetical protein